MNWQQLAIAALCLWTAITTVAYLREYIRRKRLQMNLDRLLAKWTYMIRVAVYADVGMFYQAASEELEKAINEED